jgi:hypothetical protein
MTHKVDLVLCQHAMIGNFQVRQRAGTWHWPNFVCHILARVDSDDTRSSEGGRSIDAVYLRVRVNRTNKGNMKRVRQ